MKGVKMCMTGTNKITITKIKLLLLCCMLGLLSACNIQEDVADTKYLTLLEEDAAKPDSLTIYEEHLLISKIYEKEWKWAYVVDEVCTQYPYTLNRNGDLDYVLDEVKKSIKMWLAPITGPGRVVPGGLPDRKVVNKFTVVDQSAEYVRGKMKVTRGDREGLVRKDPNKELDSYVFTIFFHCREDRYNYALPNCNVCSAHCNTTSFSGDRLGPEIHMFLPKRWASLATGINYADPKEESPLTPMWIGKSGVHRGSLLHEMGHLVGLSDTYYDDDPNHYTYVAEEKARAKYPNGWPPRDGPNGHNPRTMVDVHNPPADPNNLKHPFEGYHPISTMSCGDNDNVYPPDPKGRAMLAPDDEEGIWELYNQVHMP